jgi:hypothetical protein
MGTKTVTLLSLSEPRAIEQQLSAAASIPLTLVCSKLTNSISRLDRTRHGRRKALGKLIGELQLGPARKADDMLFPQQQLSLTHSGCWSIAAGTSSIKILGIGIDFEASKNIDPAATRLFMSSKERSRLGEESPHALRLWSTKEAIFKSDPDNHGHWVWNYELCNPTQHAGRAFLAGSNKHFHYFSLRLLEGVLAMAVCTGRNPL